MPILVLILYNRSIKTNMKGLLFTVLTLVAGISFAQTYDLNVENAKVKFEYVDEGVKGSVSGVKAQLKLELKDTLSTASITGTADVTTLSTGNKMRDKHLQSADFFDAKKYPEMSFTCDEVIQKGDKHYARGTLKIKDVEKTVKFRIKTSDDYISFYTTIFSLDYGVAVKKGRDTSKVKIQVIVPAK